MSIIWNKSRRVQKWVISQRWFPRICFERLQRIKNFKKYVKMLQTAYWLKWPKCKYPKNCGPDVSILAGPLSKAETFDKGLW